jgi:hypothetical protein
MNAMRSIGRNKTPADMAAAILRMHRRRPRFPLAYPAPRSISADAFYLSACLRMSASIVM